MLNLKNYITNLPSEGKAMDRFKLIAIRLKTGLKQWELAQLLGISQTTLCDLERGRRPITPEIEEKIRRAIDAAKCAEDT